MVTINAVTLNGTFPITIRDGDTVFSVKRRIGEATGLADFRLYHMSRGVYIADGNIPFRNIVQEMNLVDGDRIHVIAKLRSLPEKKKGRDHGDDEPLPKARRLRFKAKKSARKSVRKSKKSVRKSKKSARKSKKSARK